MGAIEIDFPDRHHLSAAEGWVELGDTAASKAELKRLAPQWLCHPDVLEVRWRIYARERRWECALAVARALIRVAPERCVGWIDQSYSLHEMQRTVEAWARLLPAAAKFPEVATIPYNLACYACRLGKLAQARSWLVRAIEIDGEGPVKRLARSDPDLQPLWGELDNLPRNSKPPQPTTELA
jgi:tetratricopeptide (TPR) repeat protein